MSALDTFLTQPYDYEHFKDFIIESFGSKAQNIKTEQPHLYKAGNIIKSYAKLCEPILLESDELGIFAFETQSIDAKVTLHKELSSIIKNNALDMSAILAVFYDKNDKENFRLSLVTQGYDYNLNKPAFSNPRRFSFTLGENAKIKTAKEQLQKFINVKDKSLDTLQEAFSVEPVTKEFYAKYKGLYENLSQKLSANHAALNALNGYEGLSETKAINAFVKKLLGRIVFLYFLQKKGWLGVPKDMPYGSGDKGFLYTTFQKSKEKNVSFYATYLCPLFFESLNTKHENDYSSLFESKIPFLNGGLFEAFTKQINGRKENMESSPFICEALDNSDFEAIFDVFESYNFTIEESTPDNTEIGIDPEMLGKVFENLIDYNKQTGAFYTPREIVHFMCQNAITRTLQERHATTQEQKEAIYNLIFHAKTDDFISQNTTTLTHAIKSLKILDPSLGSGAFPMGLLNEILRILHLLNPTMQAQDIAALKREIIQKQIYGIDIDADAIEIAKLRFWLSIAVDEDTPAPLPNLDFKFMQGNSLIETLEGIEVIAARDMNAPIHQVNLLGERDINASIFDLNATQKLEQLFLAYYDPNADKNALKKQILAIMKTAFDKRIKQIEEIVQSEERNPAVKQRERAKQQQNILNYKQYIQSLEQLYKDYAQNDFHTDKCFLYRFFFAPVFAQGGFDIVIGNPPYIRQEDIPNKHTILNEFKDFVCHSKHYKFANSSADIYTYFYAKGLNLLQNGGFLSFITSNKWCRGGYGKNLRELLLDFCIDSHYDFNGVKIFKTATVDTAITTIYATPTQSEHIFPHFLFKREYQISSSLMIFFKENAQDCPQKFLNKENFAFNDEETQALKDKIEAIGTPLKDWDINIYRGILTGYNEAFIIDTKKREEILSACDDSEESLLPFPLSEYDPNRTLD